MYLSEPAIDASLRAIARWSPPRSTLAMTYFARTRIEEPSWATKLVAAVVSTLGEPWRWGWKPEELSGYLAARGLALVDDVAIAVAARELWPPELSALVADPERRVRWGAVRLHSHTYMYVCDRLIVDAARPGPAQHTEEQRRLHEQQPSATPNAWSTGTWPDSWATSPAPPSSR